MTVFCLHSVDSKLHWFVDQHSSVGALNDRLTLFRSRANLSALRKSIAILNYDNSFHNLNMLAIVDRSECSICFFPFVVNKYSSPCSSVSCQSNNYTNTDILF